MKKIWDSFPIELQAAIIIPAAVAWSILIIGLASFLLILMFRAAGIQ